MNPERCPTCGGDDPRYVRYEGERPKCGTCGSPKSEWDQFSEDNPCPDDFHRPDEGEQADQPELGEEKRWRIRRTGARFITRAEGSTAWQTYQEAHVRVVGPDTDWIEVVPATRLRAAEHRAAEAEQKRKKDVRAYEDLVRRLRERAEKAEDAARTESKRAEEAVEALRRCGRRAARPDAYQDPLGDVEHIVRSTLAHLDPSEGAE